MVSIITVQNIVKHGEDMNKEIDIVIQKLKWDLHELFVKTMHLISEQARSWSISEITKNIAKLNILLNSDNVGGVSAYTNP